MFVRLFEVRGQRTTKLEEKKVNVDQRLTIRLSDLNGRIDPVNPESQISQLFEGAALASRWLTLLALQPPAPHVILLLSDSFVFATQRKKTIIALQKVALTAIIVTRRPIITRFYWLRGRRLAKCSPAAADCLSFPQKLLSKRSQKLHLGSELSAWSCWLCTRITFLRESRRQKNKTKVRNITKNNLNLIIDVFVTFILTVCLYF